MFLNKERHEKGKTAPRAIEAIKLGFASDLKTRPCQVIEKTGQILTSDQLQFYEIFSPYWKEELISRLDDRENEIDILCKASALIQWLSYSLDLQLATFKKVNMGSDCLLILQSPNDHNASPMAGPSQADCTGSAQTRDNTENAFSL